MGELDDRFAQGGIGRVVAAAGNETAVELQFRAGQAGEAHHCGIVAAKFIDRQLDPEMPQPIGDLLHQIELFDNLAFLDVDEKAGPFRKARFVRLHNCDDVKLSQHSYRYVDRHRQMDAQHGEIEPHLQRGRQCQFRQPHEARIRGT